MMSYISHRTFWNIDRSLPNRYTLMALPTWDFEIIQIVVHLRCDVVPIYETLLYKNNATL